MALRCSFPIRVRYAACDTLQAEAKNAPWHSAIHNTTGAAVVNDTATKPLMPARRRVAVDSCDAKCHDVESQRAAWDQLQEQWQACTPLKLAVHVHVHSCIFPATSLYRYRRCHLPCRRKMTSTWRSVRSRPHPQRFVLRPFAPHLWPWLYLT